ncbi:MAG: phosphatidate cytidylyltransferase [Tuberibacillus sp.]
MKERIITGVVAGALFLALLYIGHLPFSLLITLIACISFHELIAMTKSEKVLFAEVLGVITVIFLVLHDQLDDYLNLSMIDLWLVLTVLLLLTSVFTNNKFHYGQAAFVSFSAFYIGLSFHYFVLARENGLGVILFILILVWTTDSGAYFVGRKLGKHKLAPHISPNKTIEGMVGGVVLAIVAAIIFQSIAGVTELDSMVKLLGVAILISIFGQLGDLAESGLKRHFDIKDSGKILPGHGGLLDRFDSFIFILPILHLFRFFDF